jgi:hypothetical protein
VKRKKKIDRSQNLNTDRQRLQPGKWKVDVGPAPFQANIEKRAWEETTVGSNWSRHSSSSSHLILSVGSPTLVKAARALVTARSGCRWL